MQNLSFLDNLEVAQKFVVEVPEIIWWSEVIIVLALGLDPS